MTMDLERYSQALRNEYIAGIIKYSGGAISHKEATWICMTNFRPTDYFPGSQIIHKGPLHDAKDYVRRKGLLCEYYQHNPNR